MRSRLHRHGRPRLSRAVAVAASAAAVLGTGALAGATTASAAPASSATTAGTGHHSGIQHVLLISVDGLHQQDLAWYVKTYPNSVLAGLYDHGLEYSAAMTPFPSDSTPGMVAQVTGGNPRTTGDLLRRHVEPRRVPGRHDELLRPSARWRGPLRGGARHRPELARRRPGPERTAGQHPVDDQQPERRPEPQGDGRGPRDLQADLPEPVPEGQHDLQRGARPRAAHRVVGQAPRVPDVRRAVRQRGR